jgi:hypothetical protein
MAEPIRISTNKYTKKGKVEIDGKVWSVVLPGAGTELKLSQAQRRIKMLEKKVESGEATEVDLDNYDAYEKVIYDVFVNIFKDGTEDNSEVTAWINETPMSVISMALEDIKQAANGEDDGSKDSSSTS